MLTPKSPNPYMNEMIMSFLKKYIKVEENIRERFSRISNKFNKKNKCLWKEKHLSL